MQIGSFDSFCICESTWTIESSQTCYCSWERMGDLVKNIRETRQEHRTCSCPGTFSFQRSRRSLSSKELANRRICRHQRHHEPDRKWWRLRRLRRRLMGRRRRPPTQKLSRSTWRTPTRWETLAGHPKIVSSTNVRVSKARAESFRSSEEGSVLLVLLDFPTVRTENQIFFVTKVGGRLPAK